MTVLDTALSAVMSEFADVLLREVGDGRVDVETRRTLDGSLVADFLATVEYRCAQRVTLDTEMLERDTAVALDHLVQLQIKPFGARLRRATLAAGLAFHRVIDQGPAPDPRVLEIRERCADRRASGYTLDMVTSAMLNDLEYLLTLVYAEKSPA